MPLPDRSPETTPVGQPTPVQHRPSSTPIEQATQEAVQAARQSDQFSMMLAAVQAAQIAQQQPTAMQQMPAQRQSGVAAKWIGIGIGGSVFLMTIAVSAVAVAIAAVALTICVLVLRSVWTDVRKGR